MLGGGISPVDHLVQFLDAFLTLLPGNVMSITLQDELGIGLGSPLGFAMPLRPEFIANMQVYCNSHVPTGFSFIFLCAPFLVPVSYHHPPASASF